MVDVLRNRTYRHLLLAQVIALLGTGLATVALGLLAFDLAGAEAGSVLGTALMIKMLAYVGIAPIASAFADRVPRRRLLVALDLSRAGVALCLPFVDQIWQIYLLIFVLQASSAAFTPTFQATIPDVLTDEKAYARALSLSRIAYDLESLASPALAAALLLVVGFPSLFFGTALGFVASALLVLSVVLPSPPPGPPRAVHERTTRGARIYFATPRLRGLLAVTVAAAAAGAMVIVNTVVLVQGSLGLGQADVAIALAVFGAGSMLVALGLPKLADRWSLRSLMLGAALLVGATLVAAALVATTLAGLVACWFLLGVACSLIQTPAGQLLALSAAAVDRPALYAAQFALSHVCWLLTYPLAGWVGAGAGMASSFAVLGAIALLAWAAGWRLWPAADPDEIEHRHDDLQVGHPHLAGVAGGEPHRHRYVIDDIHPRWPT